MQKSVERVRGKYSTNVQKYNKLTLSYTLRSAGENDFCTVLKMLFKFLIHKHYVISDLPAGGYVLVGILIVFTTATIAIYAEEVVFLLRNFKNPSRRKKTLWILAFFPVKMLFRSVILRNNFLQSSGRYFEVRLTCGRDA
jgi:hypothetical protein